MSGSILPLRDVPFLEDRDAVLRHLSTGVLPLKFAYTGSGAYAHARFSGSGGYERVVSGGSLEEAVLRTVKPQAGMVAQLVEIGPGNGRRTGALLSTLASRHCQWHRYLAIDVSATLLSMACDVVRAEVPRMTVSGATWDIESDTSDAIAGWRRGSGPLTACLFGHTLGNMESAVEALRNVRNSLRPGDHLVTGLTMRPDTDFDVLDAYRTADFRISVLQPLLAVGIDAADLDFHLDYSNGAVVGTAILLRSTQVGDAYLPAGYRLRCFRSRRFTTDEVHQTFADAGWQIEDKRFDRTGDHSIVTAIRREGKSYAE
jgi:L-histidine Nalpha-methyltransferase